MNKALVLSTLLAAFSAYSQQVTLTWDYDYNPDQPQESIRFKVYRSTHPDVLNYSIVGDQINTLTFSNIGLPTPAKLRYVVTALHTGTVLESDYSNFVDINTYPLKPVTTLVGQLNSGNLTLTWIAPSQYLNDDNVGSETLKYKVFVSNSDFANSTLVVSGLTSPTHTINAVPIGNKNYFVVAYAFSGIDSAPAQYNFKYTKPAAPVIISVTPQ